MSVAARFEATASDDLSSPFYFNASHWRAMDGIIEGVNARDGIMVMTGPTGCGKTMLMRAISENLGEGARPLFLQYASLNFREFVNFLHKSLDVSDHVLDASNKAVALRKFLYAQAERGETAVVLIDEAQNLEPDVLRMLPKLARFDQLENGTNVGLQFVLTGGSELREVLADGDCAEVRQAVAHDFELRFFSRKELKHFLEKRLSPLSKLTPEPITESAIEAVGKYTGGSPRLIGMICSHAMLFAAENPGRSIDEAMIDEAAEAQMIDPIEDPFAGQDDDTDLETGPFSSAELSGDERQGGTNRRGYDADDRGDEVHDLGAESSFEADDFEDRADRRMEGERDDSAMDQSFMDDFDFDSDEDDDDDVSGVDVMDRISGGGSVSMDDDDEFERADHTNAGLAGAGAAAGSVMGRIRAAVAGDGTASDMTRIVGTGRKGRNSERSAAPGAKRAMRTRVAGKRKMQVKYVAGAAAVAGLVFGVYMIRTELSTVFASTPDPVGGAGLAERQVAEAPAPEFGTRLGAPLNGGMEDFQVSSPFDTAPEGMGEQIVAATGGGWGAEVKVMTPTQKPAGFPTKLPQLSAPKLPESGVGIARGALDLVDAALGKSKSVLPDTMGGAIDVAMGDVQELRVRTTANGTSGEGLDARVTAIIAEGNTYFERRLYIAPARANAYDSYRAALDLDPGNDAALQGIEKLRAFYAEKAEQARANKQWDDANRFFETALGISQRKPVR